MTVKELIDFLEQESPLFLQEGYDNSGLQWGNPKQDVKKVLVCLDFTREALEEAVRENAHLVVSHHPILFKPLKRILTDTGKGAMLAECIRKNISVYAAHTNFDTAKNGLNDCLAKILGLEKIIGLKTHYREILYKLVVYIPEGSLEKVKKAIYTAGAGWIGNYSDCGFSVKGKGTFRPLEGTNPYIGRQGQLEEAEEYRLETVVPEGRLEDVVESMLQAHPYEEVAYDIFRLEQGGNQYSLGSVGILKEKLKTNELIEYVKNKLNVHHVRTIGRPNSNTINRIAVFCGSFDGDVNALKSKKADALVTGDLKYHDAQELEQAGIFTIDAGHYHTEKLFISEISDRLKKQFKDVIIIEHYGKDVFDYN